MSNIVPMGSSAGGKFDAVDIVIEFHANEDEILNTVARAPDTLEREIKRVLSSYTERRLNASPFATQEPEVADDQKTAKAFFKLMMEPKADTHIVLDPLSLRNLEDAVRRDLAATLHMPNDKVNINFKTRPAFINNLLTSGHRIPTEDGGVMGNLPVPANQQSPTSLGNGSVVLIPSQAPQQDSSLIIDNALMRDKLERSAEEVKKLEKKIEELKPRFKHLFLSVALGSAAFGFSGLAYGVASHVGASEFENLKVANVTLLNEKIAAEKEAIAAVKEKDNLAAAYAWRRDRVEADYNTFNERISELVKQTGKNDALKDLPKAPPEYPVVKPGDKPF